MEAQPLLSPLLDWLIVLLSLGLPGGAGGEHDPRLLRIVPADAVIALEWAAPNATGAPADRFQSWLADPEIHRATQAMVQLRDQLHPYTSPVDDPSLSGLRERWPAIAERLWHYPGMFYIAWDPVAGGKLIPRAAIVLNVGENAAAARKDLQEVLPAWMLAEPGQSVIPNALWRFRQANGYFIWALGSETVDRISAALQPSPQAPAENAALLAAVNEWDVPRPGHRLWVNLPIDEWQRKNPALWERTPLSAVAELLPGWCSLSVLGSDDTGLVSRTVWLSSPSRPVATWLLPLGKNPLHYIPRDAHYAVSVGVSLADVTRWCALAVEHVPSVPPDLAEHGRQRVEEQLGIDLHKDLLPVLGSTWTIYSAPSTGGPWGISPIITVDLCDSRQAEQLLDKILQTVQQRQSATPGTSGWQEERFFGRRIFTLKGVSLGSLACSPTVCITDDQLTLALHTQTLRGHIRFLDSKALSLADRPECTIPGDARGFLFVDSPAIMSTLWPVASLLTATALHERPLINTEFPITAIPSTAAIVSATRPAVGVWRATDTTLVAEMRNPLSALAPAFTSAVIASVLHNPATHHNAPLDLPTPEGPSIDLGAPTESMSLNEEPASALDAIAPPGKAEPIPTVVPETPRRVWLSGLIRAVTPDDVEAAIPSSVFDRIERGPSPLELQRREERRKARDARKKPQPR